MNTFDFMIAEKDNRILSIRPKDGSNLKADLIGLAEKKKWSLNLYVLEVLEQHVKRSKSNGKKS